MQEEPRLISWKVYGFRRVFKVHKHFENLRQSATNNNSMLQRSKEGTSDNLALVSKRPKQINHIQRGISHIKLYWFLGVGDLNGYLEDMEEAIAKGDLWIAALQDLLIFKAAHWG